MFATSTNQQVRVRYSGKFELLSNAVVVDIIDRQVPLLHAHCEPAHCLHDIPAATVSDRYLKTQAGIAGRLLLGCRDLVLQSRLKLLTCADKPEPYIILMQFIDLSLQRLNEKPHQFADLLARTAPVLAAECKHGQV